MWTTTMLQSEDVWISELTGCNRNMKTNKIFVWVSIHLSSNVFTNIILEPLNKTLKQAPREGYILKTSHLGAETV